MFRLLRCREVARYLRATVEEVVKASELVGRRGRKKLSLCMASFIDGPRANLLS